MKWSDIIRADIIMSATGPSAQIMSDQITSDKVYTAKERIAGKGLCYRVEAWGLEKGRPKEVSKLEVWTAEGRDGDWR